MIRADARSAGRHRHLPLHRHRGLDAAAARARRERYADALAEHRRLLREAFARTAGSRSTRRATRSSSPSRARRTRSPRRARAGGARRRGRSACGWASTRASRCSTDEGYVGIDVHRAARIAAAGTAARCWSRRRPRDLVGAGALRDLGEHRLKDLTAPERLYQLGDGEFPPLKSLEPDESAGAADAAPRARAGARRGGRAPARNGARLVTLTGPGGTGKTRLAVQAAAEVVDERSTHGVFWVRLRGDRAIPELVLPTIAQTLGAQGRARRARRRPRGCCSCSTTSSRCSTPRRARRELLAACPHLEAPRHQPRAAAARGRARVPGAAASSSEDAVELFIARARAVRPEFEDDELGAPRSAGGSTACRSRSSWPRRA